MLFQSKSRGGLRAVGNVLTKRGDWIGSGGVFAHNDDDESTDPTPSPIHSLDLTAAPSASNAFDDYGLATSRTVTDYSGRIVQIPADAVPMGGLRPVRNLWPTADGSDTPSTQVITVTSGRVYQLRIGAESASGATAVCSGAFTGTLTGDGADIQAFDTGKTATTTSLTVTITGSVRKIQLQDITHRADLSTAPDEYVSTDDDYGTGVNGFRYFDTELDNTVASNVVTEGTGASIAGWLDYQPGATNLQRYSNDLTQRTKHSFGTGATTPIVTAAYADGPLGPSSATRVQFNRGTDTNGYSLLLDLQTQGAAETAYTHSVWARAVSGTANISVHVSGNRVDPVNGGDNGYSIVELTENWRRVNSENAITGTGGSTLSSGIGLIGSDYAANCDQTADILVCAQQFETGTLPTTYIPTTTGSAYRPAMSPAPTISGLVGTEDARLTVKGLAADLVTPDPTDTTERTLDVDNTDGEFDTLPSPIKVLSIDVYNDGERP